MICIKEDLITCSDCSMPSKHLPILSYHNIQNRHKGATIQAFFPLFPHKRTMSTQKIVFEGVVHYPSHSKQGENQLPPIFCYKATKKQVINRLFIPFTHVAFVWKNPTPPFKLINSKDRLWRSSALPKPLQTRREPTTTKFLLYSNEEASDQ